MADRTDDVARRMALDAPTQVSIVPGPQVLPRPQARPPSSPELARGSARAAEATAPDVGPCVDTDDLAAMIAGELPAERVDAVLVHVDRCEICAEVMATLGGLEGDVAAAQPAAGRYQLGKVLGSGGMGIVYDAWDPQLRRRVALKVVRPEQHDAASQERMWREARALARVSHPNVVAVYDVSEQAGQICIATELVDGETLATWQHGKSTAQIADAWLQAARGLAAAHAGGIVHRDVKPANVFVGRDGRVRVGDFGLARLGSELALGASGSALPAVGDNRVTATGFAAGTPAYMAPEQLRGEVDARSDQFALCVALTEALTGERPVADAMPDVAGAPALRGLLARGLREDPAMRYPSMDALVDALAAVTSPPAAPPPRRRVGWIAAAGAVLLGGVTALLLRSDHAPCAPTSPEDAMWSTARRDALASVMPSAVLSQIDVWFSTWTVTARAACQLDDQAMRVRGARCLYDQLQPVHALVERWAAGAGRAPAASTAAIEDLPQLTRCAREVLQSASDLSPPQVMQRIALGMRLELAGQDPAALAEIAAAAPGTGDVVFATRAAIAQANREADPARATAIVRQAIATADGAHVGLAGAMARVALLSRIGADPDHEATDIADAARQAIARLGYGYDYALEADLDFNLASILASRSQYERAAALFEQAQRAARTAYGPSSLHEGNILISLAGAYAALDPNGPRVRDARDAAIQIFARAKLPVPMLDDLGQLGRDPAGLVARLTKIVDHLQHTEPGSANLAEGEFALGGALVVAEHDDQAILHYQRAVAINDKLGVKNAKQAAALSQIAAMLREARRAGEAVPVARRAVQIAEDISDELELGAALNNLGAALLEVHATDEARAVLERSLVIRERTHEPAQFRGRTRFLLATATWSRDPKRAQDLAHAARVDLQGFVDSLDPKDPSKAFLRKEQEGRLADIDRWIAQHR